MTSLEMLTRLRDRLNAREPTLGTFLNLGSPVVAEVAGCAGFDWCVVDLEHGSGSEAQLLSQLVALELRSVVAVVRIESNLRPRFSFALDKGASGIMVPRINTTEEAAEAVRHLRYPPVGDRGVATLNRACGFGRSAAAVVPGFNDVVLGVIQVETPRSIQEIEAIAALQGVDVLFVGPTDLTHAMGIPGQVGHPKFQAGLTAVLAAAQESGKSAGIFASSWDEAEHYVEQGFTFVAVGSESSLMLRAMSEGLNELRERLSLSIVEEQDRGLERLR